MPCAFISDKKREYHEFLTELAETLEDYDVEGIAIVALTKEETLTGYWNMSVEDKGKAELHIRSDMVDQMIMANRDRYWGDEE